ncbi:MAG: hypothetical protein RIB60_11680 [Phycisphaerales bacterium]
MTRTILKWALPLAALLVAGPLWSLAVGSLRAPDGGHDVTFIHSQSIAMSLLIGLGAFAVAGLLGFIAARLFGPRVGVFVWGLGLLWPAWTTGRMGVILRTNPETGVLIMLAIEALILGVGAIVGVAFLARCHDAATHASDDAKRVIPFAHNFVAQIRDTFRTSAGLVSLATGAAAALGLAWVIGQTDLRGQALLAAFGAGIGAAVVGRLVGTSMAKDAPIAATFLAVALAGVLAPLIAIVYPGTNNLASSVIEHELPGFLALQPADWAIGLLLGVPTGLSWVGELEHLEPGAKPAKA